MNSKFTILSLRLIPLIVSFYTVVIFSGWDFLSTYYIAIPELLIVLFFYYIKINTKNNIIPNEERWLRYFFLFIYISTFIKVFRVDGYWDIKILAFNTMSFMLINIIYIGLDQDKTKIFLRGFFLLVLPSTFIVYFILGNSGYGDYLGLLPIFIIAIPYMKKKWAFSFFLIYLLIVISDISARSVLIRFSIAMIIVVLYKYIDNIKNIALKLFKVIYLLPFIFIVLAIFFDFNIFEIKSFNNENETIEINSTVQGEQVTENLLEDTRTFLYYDVLTSSMKNSDWITGTVNGGYEPISAFTELSDNYDGKQTRNNAEVFILNIYDYLGFLGIFLIIPIFYCSSLLAMKYSNNRFIKMLSLYVTFNWLYSWVENYNGFNITFLGMFLSIGMCYSIQFRGLTDDQFSVWIKNVMK